MARKFLAALAIPVLLSGCATTGESVRLNTNRAFYAAQVAFKSVQQIILATCSAPARPVAKCNAAIDLLHAGAQAETAAFTAQQAGNAASLQAALITLTALPSQLAALGILEAN